MADTEVLHKICMEVIDDFSSDMNKLGDAAWDKFMSKCEEADIALWHAEESSVRYSATGANVMGWDLISQSLIVDFNFGSMSLPEDGTPCVLVKYKKEVSYGQVPQDSNAFP